MAIQGNLKFELASGQYLGVRTSDTGDSVELFIENASEVELQSLPLTSEEAAEFQNVFNLIKSLAASA